MDPNATLAELRQLTADTLAIDASYTTPGQNRMAELFDSLDEWISRGGFLPAGWEHEK